MTKLGLENLHLREGSDKVSKESRSRFYREEWWLKGFLPGAVRKDCKKRGFDKVPRQQKHPFSGEYNQPALCVCALSVPSSLPDKILGSHIRNPRQEQTK